MQPISLRTNFLVLTSLVVIAATGGLGTACSTTPQNQSQAPNTAATDTDGMEGMDHGSMDHGSMDHGMAMDLGPADANYDLRFIDAMSLHHQGAVAMAQEAQQKSQRPEIEKLADNIIDSQNKEIKQLAQWRKAWYPQANNEPVTYGGNGNPTAAMSQQQHQNMTMQHNLGPADAEFDLRFIDAMIPHHEGALTMAQDALKKSKRPEIKQLAQEIIKSQQAEIEQMQQWRQAWYQK
jgi:uncharacterized protein (DUF305 family)